MGALMMDTGPKVGEAAPRFDLTGLGGEAVAVGAPTGAASTLLFFLSPTCPVCKKLLPLLRSLRDAERSQLAVVLAKPPPVHQHLHARRVRRARRLDLQRPGRPPSETGEGPRRRWRAPGTVTMIAPAWKPH